MKTSKLISILFFVMITLNTVYGQNQPVYPSKNYRIVVEKMDSTTETGILEEIKDSSVVIIFKSHNDFSKKEINYSNINSIKLRRTGRTVSGSLIGFGSGILVGGIMGAVLYKLPVEEPLNQLYDDAIGKPAAIAAGIIIGGILGSLIGGAVGSANSVFVINGNYKNYQVQKFEIIKLVTYLK